MDKKIFFRITLFAVIAIFVVKFGFDFVKRSSNDMEEEVSFYITNNHNDRLFKLSIKRCFLSQYDGNSKNIQQGDKLRMVWLNFPTYTFSGEYPYQHEKIFDQCPDKNTGLTLVYIQSSDRKIESRVNFYSREEKDNMIYFSGRDKINTLFIPTQRTRLDNLKLLVHVNLDNKERQKYHGGFLNSYEVTSPLNDDVELNYTIYTRFYRYLPEIQDTHKKMSKEQCMPEVAYCVANNPADIIYDAVQREDNLLNCKECIASLLANDEQVANFFLKLKQ